jgi:manganese transport system permease protein
VATVIVVSVRVLGVLLIAAAVVIPAAGARLLTPSLGPMLLVATVMGAGATTVGLYLSFWFDVASGASIVLVEAALFTLAAFATSLAARRRVVLARRP